MIWQLIEDPECELTASDMEYWDAIHDALKAKLTHPHPQAVPDDVVKDAEKLARTFHDVYERLAPSFGYETRKDTREFDPESSNGRLMIAACREIAAMLKEGK